MKTNKLTLGLLTTAIVFTGMATTAYGAEGKRGGNLSEELREQMHAIVLDGDYDEYVAFATDNDLRVMDEEQFDQKSDRAEQRSDAHEAVLDGDYDEWRSIVGDEKMTDIDEDNFYLLTDMANAKESGDQDDIDVAKTALAEAGIEREHKRGDKGPRGDRDGGRPNFAERNGVDREAVSNMTDEEKEDLLESIINQIKTRLGLI